MECLNTFQRIEGALRNCFQLVVIKWQEVQVSKTRKWVLFHSTDVIAIQQPVIQDTKLVSFVSSIQEECESLVAWFTSAVSTADRSNFDWLVIVLLFLPLFTNNNKSNINNSITLHEKGWTRDIVKLVITMWVEGGGHRRGSIRERWKRVE